jgi:hypothetical protein
MGPDYYPQWLDNLAGDVTFEATAMDGTAHGAADVRSIVVTAKELCENPQFSYAGPCGDNGFLELYTTDVRGVTHPRRGGDLQRRRSDTANRGETAAAQRAAVLLSRDAREVRQHPLG